jgi:hypothetical protein
MVNKHALALLIGIVFAGCSPSRYEDSRATCRQAETGAMNSWMGMHKADLIQQNGAPARNMPDGKGGEVLIYERRVVFPQQGIAATRVWE